MIANRCRHSNDNHVYYLFFKAQLVPTNIWLPLKGGMTVDKTWFNV